MKAIEIHQFGAPEVLRFEDVAEPVAGPGEVVVEVHAVGDGVDHVAPGDRVAVLSRAAPGGAGTDWEAAPNPSGQVEMTRSDAGVVRISPAPS